MNKKLVYIFAVLVAGIFLISACQQDAVGGRRISPTIPREKQLDWGEGGLVTCLCSQGGTGDCDLKNTKIRDDEGFDVWKIECVKKANRPCSSSCGGTSTSMDETEGSVI